MYREDIKQKFINFLKKRKCYKNFITNLENYPIDNDIKTIDDLLINFNYRNLIYGAFRWDIIPEGAAFWRHLDDVWYWYIRNFLEN